MSIKKRLLKNRMIRKRGLIIYVNGGDPDIETTREIILFLAKHHVDIIELGVPFPNSITDGPQILRSHERALKQGVEFEGVIEMVKDIRKECDIPLVLLADYSHTVKSRGIDYFLSSCKCAGVNGTLIHCLPPLLVNEYVDLAKHHNVETVFSLYPSTNEKKRETVYQISSGFIYIVSYYGRTGSSSGITEETVSFLKKIRSETDLPLAVGFGIKNANDLDLIYSANMDAAIIGSPIVNITEMNLSDRENLFRELKNYLSELKSKKYHSINAKNR